MSEPVRVTVWGENRHEQIEEHVAKIYPQGMHTTIAEGIVENLGDGVHRAHRDPRRSRARPDRGGPRRHRRPHLVGPRRARGGGRRGRRARAPPRPGGDGADRAALRALVEDLHEADGHLVHAAVAQRARPRADLDGQPDPPHRARRAAPDRHRRGRDVRGVLRHPGARRAGLPVTRSAAGRCSAAAPRSAAATARSSTSGPATRTTRPTTTATSARSSPTAWSGRAPTTRPGAPRSCSATRRASSSSGTSYAGPLR